MRQCIRLCFRLESWSNCCFSRSRLQGKLQASICTCVGDNMVRQSDQLFRYAVLILRFVSQQHVVFLLRSSRNMLHFKLFQVLLVAGPCTLLSLCAFNTI